MRKSALIALVAGLALVSGAVALVQRSAGGGVTERQLTDGAGDGAASHTISPPLRALSGAEQWINTPPLRAEDLRGKVVLVNFWTYTCINSLRPLPYLRAWAERYRDRGLVVIGVHSPEFGFEHDLANVVGAAESLNVGYPVAIDNDLGIWRAFGNGAWPGFYFIDASGRIRDRKFGEGGYEQSERLIQRLLEEAGATVDAGEIAAAAGVGAQAAPDFGNLRSPETYIGHARADSLASAGGARRDRPAVYRAPEALRLNRWSLSGDWTVGGESAALNEASGAIAHRFHARDLHLVLAPSAPGRTVRLRITLDGAAPGADHGFDVDAEGWGRVDEARMYQLVRQAGPVAERTFRIEFLDAGVRAYAFTFG